ncbi:MAG: hypothetical protein BGO43_00145 [Gammaproteobacteria bacterium 39-13]|nr:hypothetical protein [Gammaproteobacteria bacterium]OJV96675.1 MAG: hypothetical protein BGO43_00145 [Gammaproteobacteria bacterium 39-13]
MLLPKEHISYQAQNKIREMLSPLEKLGSIHYFSYGVNYPDGSCFTLHTNSDFYESWFEYQFPLCGFELPKGWHSWSTHLPNKQIEVANELDLGCGVDFVNHKQEKTEIFSFASKPENFRVYDFYLNNKHLLKKFAHYFIENAADLIHIADHQRVIPLPSMIRGNMHHRDPLLSQETHTASNDIFRHNLLNNLNYPFNLLSERESECFNLMIKNYSIADIGEELKIAVPTVAVYIARIKQKLKCKNKKELIEKAHEAGLVEYYFT